MSYEKGRQFAAATGMMKLPRIKVQGKRNKIICPKAVQRFHELCAEGTII